MADLQDFVGTWRADREAPWSSHTFTWARNVDGLRGEWTIEAAVPRAADRVQEPAASPQRLQVQIGEPSLDEGRVLFHLNGGPFITEFRLVAPNEAIVGAAVDKLPPELAGPEYQRSIEGHRVRLRKLSDTHPTPMAGPPR